MKEIMELRHFTQEELSTLSLLNNVKLEPVLPIILKNVDEYDEQMIRSIWTIAYSDPNNTEYAGFLYTLASDIKFNKRIRATAEQMNGGEGYFPIEAIFASLAEFHRVANLPEDDVYFVTKRYRP